MKQESKKNTNVFDPGFVQSLMKQMDRDVALRFIASGFSLDTQKIKEAFVFACEEMVVRETEKGKAAQKQTSDEIINSAKSITDDLQATFTISATLDDENKKTE